MSSPSSVAAAAPADDFRVPVTANVYHWVLFASLATSLGSLVWAVVLAVYVLRQPTGTVKMREIAESIKQGANAYLSRQYLMLLVFVLAASIVIGFVNFDVGGWQPFVCFLCGAALSGLTGYIGMSIAVRANVRTTAAAMVPGGLSRGLRLAFNAGSVMGLSVVSFGLGGLSGLILLFTTNAAFARTNQPSPSPIFEYMAGFAMGASSVALFARVGGGVYTKAADVGADLVGKVEQGIPEDDPRNPGVIADNVGDNVGDVAGMGADLFESFCGSIIAAATLGDGVRAAGVELAVTDYQAVALPFLISAAGIVAAIIGALLFLGFSALFLGESASQGALLWAMRSGIFSAAGLHVIFVAILDHLVLQVKWEYTVSIYIGLVAGLLIAWFTEYATSFEYRPTRSISYAGVTGPATVIIQGLGVGQLSTFPPVAVLCVTIMLCLILGGVYAVSIAAVGMLATLGITLSTDAYGPVADNAGGIAEMAELDEEVRERTDALDALGNTTAATGKGFAIGSAVLTALALMTAFSQRVGLAAVDVVPTRGINFVIPGILFGTMLPFIFSALTMLAVGKSAQSIIQEVRRQFREIPGLMEGTANADHARCVAISTTAALREMVLPGFIAIITPFIVGIGFGAEALAGLLIGAISSGFLLAVNMANSGGAWDNSKKFIEAGGGDLGGKGTPIHAAAVTGDTVGDPFKDTSGPSLNILIKLTSIVALVMAPAFRRDFQKEYWWIALIVFTASTIFVTLWCLWLKKKELPMDVPDSAMAKEHHEEHEMAEQPRRAAAAAATATANCSTPTTCSRARA
eukprot:CAMPEP_0198338572 /NCGR_PEP_ID=MMETSP1450-20131203/35259_1 /TAXON_ID=753684 ORGANISM="Madagascaria erythrocladiodes, Strain CCMP3234" /NCGR_SAMPLE_ID=MMETSP1450 /ASSEMBLY_ACC=CAM_ASM_001115 /LENGTH=804 /DNA_ID=CAMNT_0044043455 /DNA_START=26 /DNA_END=2441 /DNA_ORIENTATION=-